MSTGSTGAAETLQEAVPAFELRRQHAWLGEELVEAAREVLLSGQFILGPKVHELEQELARRCGSTYAVGVGNGTDGLYLALRALGIGPGDDVLTTPFSFIATATSILRAGARPVFADVDPATLNLDPRSAEQALTPATRAVVVVHLFGNPADMQPLQELARRRGLLLIEDAAQAIGAQYRGQPVGSLGDAAAISFYPTKNLGGCGDGGVVLTSRAEVAERLRMLRVSGARQRYLCEDAWGINSRLDELQAALLLVKLRHLDDFNRRRRQIARLYRELLEGLPAVPLRETEGAISVYHQFTVRTPQRDGLAHYLQRQGIGCTVYYPVPLHAQPGIGPRSLVPVPLTHAEQAARDVLSLPMFPELTDAEVERVGRAVQAFFRADAGR